MSQHLFQSAASIPGQFLFKVALDRIDFSAADIECTLYITNDKTLDIRSLGSLCPTVVQRRRENPWRSIKVRRLFEAVTI